MTTVCNSSQKHRTIETQRTQVCNFHLCLSCVHSSFLASSFLQFIPLYMNWCRVQVSCSVTKWTLGSRQLNSSCSSLNRLFATLVGQVSNVVHALLLVPCAGLHTSSFATSKYLLPCYLSSHVLMFPYSQSTSMQSLLMLLPVKRKFSKYARSAHLGLQLYGTYRMT